MKRHSVSINGHKTSVSLEDEFWEVLRDTAEKRGTSIANIITKVDRMKGGNLSSKLRIYALNTALGKV